MAFWFEELGGLYQGFILFVQADMIGLQMLERGSLVPIILSWWFLELSLEVAVSLHVPAPLAAARVRAVRRVTAAV